MALQTAAFPTRPVRIATGVFVRVGAKHKNTKRTHFSLQRKQSETSYTASTQTHFSPPANPAWLCRLAFKNKRSEYISVGQFNATTCKRVLMSADVVTNLLQTHPFTEGFWPDHLARLSAMASEVRFRPGELIFREGDHSSFFYLLISGNVALEAVSPGRLLRVTTLYAGEVLGWSSVMENHNGKQFQARSLEEVHALAFDGERLRHACEEDYVFGFWFMRAILNVMFGRMHAIRAQLMGAYSPVAAGK